MLPVVIGGIVEGVVSTGVGGAIVFGMIGAMVLLSGWDLKVVSSGSVLSPDDSSVVILGSMSTRD